MNQGIGATGGGRPGASTEKSPVPGAMRRAAPRSIGRVHWRGFLTLYRREIWRFLKEWLETIVAAGFSTVVYLAVFAFALGPDRSTPEGQAILDFILPGLVLFAILNRAAETTVFSIVFDKLEGMFADLLMAPVTPSELTAAYAVAGATAGIVTGVPVAAVAALFFGLEFQAPLLAVLFTAGGALMLSLMGILVGIASTKWDHVGAFFGFFLVPLTFVSGLFAPVERLPEWFAAIVRFNPIFYVIDGFRAGCIGVHSAPVMLSAAVVAGTCAVLWIVCDRLLASGWRTRN